MVAAKDVPTVKVEKGWMGTVLALTTFCLVAAQKRWGRGTITNGPFAIGHAAHAANLRSCDLMRKPYGR